MSKWFFMGFVLLVGACQMPAKQDEDHSELETPPSFIGFTVSLPAEELADGLNRILPQQIVDDAIPVKGKDTLLLNVKRKGKLSLTIQKQEVFVSIPLEITAAIKKRVLGLTFTNESAPVVFSGVLKTSTHVSLTKNWDMDFSCKYLGFEQESQSEIVIMGIRLNVDKMIDKALNQHRDQISDIICMSINEAIDFRNIMEKLWMDLQQPQRVTRKPLPMYLHTIPSGLNGFFEDNVKDALAIHLEYRTALKVSPEKNQNPQKIKLTQRGKPMLKSNALVAYPEIFLPYSDISKPLKDILISQQFEYEGYEIIIKDVEVGREKQKLKFTIHTKGDINGEIIATGIPALNEEREFILKDFKYELISGEDWVKMTDWAVHQFAEGYIEEKVRLDSGPFFNQLDEVIMKALTNSKLGAKMEVMLNFTNLESYKVRFTDEAMQWVFFVEGDAAMTLKKGLFQKN